MTLACAFLCILPKRYNSEREREREWQLRCKVKRLDHISEAFT